MSTNEENSDVADISEDAKELLRKLVDSGPMNNKTPRKGSFELIERGFATIQHCGSNTPPYITATLDGRIKREEI